MEKTLLEPTLTGRAHGVFPAGSNGEFNLPPELTTVVQRGSGCELWGVDGKHFYDFSMGWGSVLIGHAHPAIVEAVTRAAVNGSNFACINEQALILGEEILRVSSASDRLRFCASGTEATMYCLRLARAYTGRAQTLKFEGAYHGANAVGVTSLFPTAPADYPKSQPTSAGVGRHIDRDVLVSPFNDLASAVQLIEQHADTLAAVIVEPLQRCVPPEPGFLEGLRAATQEHGVLLVFDEVVTGFRLAYGGAQEYYGVVPDLVAYGKALGGGYPIGVFGGTAEIMDLVREDRMDDPRYVWMASTLGGNPISTTAASETLSVLRGEGVYTRLHALGEYLREGMRCVLLEHGVEAQVIGDGPLAQVVFSTLPVRDYRSTQNGNCSQSRALMLRLFERGIFLNPMGTKLYLSLAHDEQVCDKFLQRFAETLE